MSDRHVLVVSDLTVAYRSSGGERVVVRDAGLAMESGCVAGLAGESGSGKSTLALAAIGYVPPGGRILRGTAFLGKRDLCHLSSRELRHVWGSEIGFVAQSASDALNPAMRIDRQLGEVLRIHKGVRGRASHQRQLELLDRVGIPDSPAALRRYPHEFSGGQLQRIAIAIAIACDPAILVLDEPTTGLDVQTQRRISALLRELVDERGLSALYVSHDLALLGEVCDSLFVMYGGQIFEEGPTGDVLRRPRHPYTRALLDSAPSVTTPRMLVGIPGLPPTHLDAIGCAFAPRCVHAQDVCRAEAVALVDIDEGRRVRCARHATIALSPEVTPLSLARAAEANEPPLLGLYDVSYRYRSSSREAVSNVSLEVRRGESVGLVGESGSGKSTLLRAIAGLVGPSHGEVRLHGRTLPRRLEQRDAESKRAIQLIFQDPSASLNPSHTIGEILIRPIRLFDSSVARGDEEEVVANWLARVRLPSELAYRYPDQLSGGQKQRVAIARAFAASPDLLLCDEITSSLDVSVQATIVSLLDELARARGVAVVFVSHDLAVVRAAAGRIAVMKDGVIVEEGDAAEIFERPRAQYTSDLLAAIPTMPGDERAPNGAVGASWRGPSGGCPWPESETVRASLHRAVTDQVVGARGGGPTISDEGTSANGDAAHARIPPQSSVSERKEGLR